MQKEHFLKHNISRVIPIGTATVLWLLVSLLGGCTWILPPPFIIAGASQSTLVVEEANEQPITILPLQGPLALPAAELSGLAWYGDTLILLPQFPEYFDRQIYGLAKESIVAYLLGQATAPLAPFPIALDDGAIRAQLTGSEGYEAIAFTGDRAYLTIETKQATGMLGYLVTGTMDQERGELRLDPTRLAPIAPQANLGNISDEAIVLIDNQVATIYEANGLAVNPEPVVHLFAQESLTPIGVVPFPQIEYRITDATALDENGRFWAMNYLFPGDRNLRSYLRTRGALAALNSEAQPVERLLEFQVSSAGITRTERPPLPLELLADSAPNTWIARNWEGIVRLETAEFNGFLIVTDRFPETILAYVPMPAQP